MTYIRKANIFAFIACLIFLAAGFVSSAKADVSKVRAVVWQGNPNSYHTTIGSANHTLKGVINSTATTGISPLSAAWKTDADNTLRVVYSGSGVAVAWVRAVINTEGAAQNTVCLYDAYGGGCPNNYNLCNNGYSWDVSFDVAATVSAGPVPESIVLERLDTCGSGSYSFFVNGTLIFTASANVSGDCTCEPGLTADSGDLETGFFNPIWYKWIYGDGTESAVETLSGAASLSVEANHIYSGAAGTPFNAQLIVSNSSSMTNPISDTYRVRIEEDTLDARVNMSVDNGLWFLYKNRLKNAGIQSMNAEPVTAWSSYSSFHPSATAAAVQAFEINNHRETGNPDEDPYVEVAAAGLNWLINGLYAGTPVLSAAAINAQAFGNPDVNGNGFGIQVNYSGYPAYQGGMIMDAIIASGTPDANSGRDFDGDGSPDTYKQIIQDMVDMYAWGQADGNDYYTGWDYGWGGGTDNSVNQWAAIGLLPAEHDFGCTVPQFVKDQNKKSLAYTYNAGGEYFGYRDQYSLVGTPGATRPSGMVQMIMSYPDYKNDPKWLGPATWYADNFTSAISTAQRTYYGWLSFVKSMRLSNTETLTKTDGAAINWYRGSGGDFTEPIDGLAWRLIMEQESDGSWPSGGQITHPGDYGDTFVTSWAIQMLRPALFAVPPEASFTATPNPGDININITFDPSASSHPDGTKQIVTYEWDWESDGTYDEVTFENTPVTHSWSVYGDYPVTLRVTDNNMPPLNDTHQVVVRLIPEVHAPVADAGGPYIVSLSAGDTLTLDGSGSYDLDEGKHEEGCPACPPDTLTAMEWDFSAAPWDYTDGSGEIVNLGAGFTTIFPTAKTYDIGLRVTDNTLLAYPSSTQTNLTHENFDTVAVYNTFAGNVTAEALCDDQGLLLSWTANGADHYEILRSTAGANIGFITIGTTANNTFTDVTFVPAPQYWYRIKAITGASETLSKSILAHLDESFSCNQPPVAMCQSVAAYADETCFASTSVDNGSYDPDGDVITVAQSPLSPYKLGETSVTLTVTDEHGISSLCTATVTVTDTTAPIITAPANLIVEATGPTTPVDPGVAVAHDNCNENPAITSDAPATFPLGTTQVTWTAADSAGNVGTATQHVTIQDTTAPVVTPPADVTAEATGLLTPVATGSATATDAVGVVSITSNAPATFPVGTTQVIWTATDAAGNTGTAQQTITVLDTAPPVVSLVSAIPNPVAINTAITLTARVDDSLAIGSDIVSAEYSIDGEALTPMLAKDGAFDNMTEDVTATIAVFTSAGVHTLCVRGTDAGGNVSAEECIFLAVYDPNGGFVTGGGWISSPVGAYQADLTLTGKANFGFVSKYQKGATIPSGNTEFQFHAESLNFHSTAYEWLVVSGARAQYKGAGTINGEGDFGFILTAIDGQRAGGGGIDRFRIKIWDKATNTIVYDNKYGVSDTSSDATELGGGGIVIHTKQ